MQTMDMLWVLICTALILLMQAGFYCLESGMARSRNGINVAVKNILDFCIASALFWLIGFGFMYGASQQGWIGASRFMPDSDSHSALVVFFLFQMVFCGTAATIVAGAVAERMRLYSYLFIAIVIATVVYPVYGHWAWGGVLDNGSSGWLRELGFVDFAGASVVHSVSGWVALAAIVVVGPRIGRFGANAQPIQGRNLPMSTLGALILGLGWIGFNGGSALAITDQIPRILMNTFICGMFGCVASVIASISLKGYIGVRYAINGFLAGLVASTAGCHAVEAWQAMIIGMVGGALAMCGSLFLERFEIDDVVDAVPTHAFAGFWGILSFALFAEEQFFGVAGGRWEQLQVQAIGAATCFVWAFGLSFIIFRTASSMFNFRVTGQQELKGSNTAEHGAKTESASLLPDTERHGNNGNFSARVRVEPHTEIGQIADQYNKVLECVETESSISSQAIHEAYRHLNRIELVSDISKTINGSQNENDAMDYTLRRIYEYTGWAFGHVYILDSDKGSLASSGLYHSSDETRYRQFADETLQLKITGNGGLIGRVFDAGESVWVSDITRDPSFARVDAARQAGLHAAFALPALSVNEVVAVLEFYSEEILETDSEMLSAMNEIGVQLGRSFERGAARNQRESIERELQFAQKLESVGRLAAGVAHEINTPVQYVSDNARFLDEAFADLLALQKAQEKLLAAAREGKMDPDLVEAVEAAVEESDWEYLEEEIPKAITQALEGTARIAKIVGAMKQFSHPGGETKQAMDINDALENTVTVASNEWKYVARVETDFDSTLPAVRCFPGELGQVFLNLLVNAAHAIASVIDEDSDEKGVIRVATRQVDDQVEIRISDTGSGIPESARDKLFEAFFTTKEVGKGTGQGLSIAHSVVVEQHGGKIDFETEMGVGTTFIVSLPIGEPDSDSIAAGEEAA